MKANDALNEMLSWMEAIGKAPKTIENTWREVDLFLHFSMFSAIRTVNVDDIDEFHLNSYINDTEKETTVGTRRYKLSALRTFLTYCVNKGWRKDNPAALVKVNIRKVPHRSREAKKKEAYTSEEIKYILANTDGFWRAAILIALETGLRIGDIVQLEWDCFTHDSIVVWTDKRDKRVDLKMSLRLHKTIANLPCLHEDYLFPEQRLDYLSPEEGGRGKRTWFPVTFKRMMNEFGIDGKTFHSLRVTHASLRSKEGEDVAEIAKDLAHSNSDTTRKHYIT